MPSMKRLTIMGLPFEAHGPSYYRLILPAIPQRSIAIDVSYIGEQEWLQCMEVDGAVSCKVYSSREEAIRPLAEALCGA